MGGKVEIECCAPGCPVKISRWRQCPNKACSQDLGFCKDHGGDEAAVRAIREHLADAHGR